MESFYNLLNEDDIVTGNKEYLTEYNLGNVFKGITGNVVATLSDYPKNDVYSISSKGYQDLVRSMSKKGAFKSKIENVYDVKKLKEKSLLKTALTNIPNMSVGDREILDDVNINDVKVRSGVRYDTKGGNVLLVSAEVDLGDAGKEDMYFVAVKGKAGKRAIGERVNGAATFSQWVEQERLKDLGNAKTKTDKTVTKAGKFKEGLLPEIKVSLGSEDKALAIVGKLNDLKDMFDGMMDATPSQIPEFEIDVDSSDTGYMYTIWSVEQLQSGKSTKRGKKIGTIVILVDGSKSALAYDKSVKNTITDIMQKL